MKGQPINSIPKFQFCSQCNFVLPPRTLKSYCCNKKLPVCPKCINIQCKICMMKRNKRLNTNCYKCNIFYDEDYIFYDFKGDKNYCAKCLSQKYIYHYEQMIKENSNPKFYMFKISSESQHCLEDFINFYKNWCFCCVKKFNNNAFEMMHGARICCQCLESNFDRTMSKLIMCVECNGYIHERSQIQFQTSLTEVLCVYCSKDEKKNSSALKKKNQSQESKIKSRSSLNKSSVIISAVQLSKIGASKLVRIISKSSIQQESLEFPITINITQQSLVCILCSCKFNQKSVFKLTDQEIDKYKQIKSIKSSVMCFVCFNSKDNQNKKPQKLERIFGVREKDAKQQEQLMKTAKIRSNKLEVAQANPILSQKNIVKSPRRLVSPKPKQILCQKCKKSKGLIETTQGFFCYKCLD